MPPGQRLTANYQPFVKARKAMKKLVYLLAVALLAACGTMPTGAQFGEVKHPDPFHSYIN